MSSARSEFTSGAKAIAPGLLGAITFATIWGIVAVAAGIPASLALALMKLPSKPTNAGFIWVLHCPYGLVGS